MSDEEAIRERAVRRIQLISYARDQREFANAQLEERYRLDTTSAERKEANQTSIAHSLAAIATLMLADKEVTP